MKTGHDFWVTLKPDICSEWRFVLGAEWDGELPVLSPTVCLADLPGFDTPQRVFRLALDCMSPDELSRISQRLALKFGLTAEEAFRELNSNGIPIREEHVDVVTVHHFQRWTD
jgi:hypothetical protein